MRRRRQADSDLATIWPGFTDALAGLVVALVFLLVLFFLFEVVLSRQVSGQETRIEALQGQVAELEAMLDTRRKKQEELQQRLRAEQEQSAGLQQRLASTETELEAAQERVADAGDTLMTLSERVARLNRRLSRIRQALAAEQTDRKRAEARAEKLADRVAEQKTRIKDQSTRIDAMAAQIQTQLLERVERLEDYRSEFFGRLREVFAESPDIGIRGDRFVFQSEILFPSGKAELTQGGKEELKQFVTVFRNRKDAIPQDMDPIILVEGFTDRVPIQTAQFRSNWELSTERALSVVHFFINQGLAPQHLAAAGYGKHQPITPGETPEQRRRNRRIEIKITNR